MRAGLLADTYLEAMRIVQHKKSYADYVLTPELEAEIEKAAQERNVFSRLAKSIAPEVSYSLIIRYYCFYLIGVRFMATKM